jgi:hypothetical protein
MSITTMTKLSSPTIHSRSLSSVLFVIDDDYCLANRTDSAFCSWTKFTGLNMSHSAGTLAHIWANARVLFGVRNFTSSASDAQIFHSDRFENILVNVVDISTLPCRGFTCVCPQH